MDTAYTNILLHPHTDGTYLRDPPGVQVFNCIRQSGQGGDTWLVDGFQVARVRLPRPSPPRCAARSP